MSKTFKRTVISSTMALLFTAGGAWNAAADGHEQARQLLQPTVSKTQGKPAISVIRVAPQDSHEQARRLFDRSYFAAEKDVAKYEGAALVVESEQGVDAHTKARNLLSRPVSSQ